MLHELKAQVGKINKNFVETMNSLGELEFYLEKFPSFDSSLEYKIYLDRPALCLSLRFNSVENAVAFSDISNNVKYLEKKVTGVCVLYTFLL